MLVFENEQIAEKVQTKMRQRAEKGLWNGGHVPFAFNRDFEKKTIVPDPEKAKIVEQMLRIYTESRSDFKVRDWLRSQHIPSPTGRPVWAVGAVRGVLTNRIYLGEIQVNRRNKGLDLDDVPETERYRIAKATFEPLVPREIFELAQRMREEKGRVSADRIGRPRTYGHNKCGRVYSLQGALVCGVCGHSMTPHYTYHKPGNGRRTESYIHYYVCSPQIRGVKTNAHTNRILARRAEGALVETVQELVSSRGLLEACFENATRNFEQQVRPQQDALAISANALRENQTQIDNLIETISSGKADSALFELLNSRASELKIKRQLLLVEQRRLREALMPLDGSVSPETFRDQLIEFADIVDARATRRNAAVDAADREENRMDAKRGEPAGLFCLARSGSSDNRCLKSKNLP